MFSLLRRPKRGKPFQLANRLRKKAFIWSLARDAQARQALLMNKVATDEAGLFDLAVRGLKEPLKLRATASDDDRATVWELFYFHAYDAPLPITKWKTILDLGANVGLFAAYLAWRGVPVETYIAAEPDPKTHALLREQITRLGWKTPRLHNVAVGDRPGTMRFDSHGPSITRQLSDEGDLEVKVTTVNALLDDAKVDKVDLMKIDIEGGERSVFEHAGDWAHRVPRIVTELHYDMDTAWLRNQLGPHGYTVFELGTLFHDNHAAIHESKLHEVPRDILDAARKA